MCLVRVVPNFLHAFPFIFIIIKSFCYLDNIILCFTLSELTSNTVESGVS